MKHNDQIAARPAWATQLETVFGPSNTNAFGTAVFFEQANAIADFNLEARALFWYQFFCGTAWEKLGPENWLGTWQSVFKSASPASIVTTIANLDDASAKMSGTLLFEGHNDPQAAKAALENAFDDAAICGLEIFRIGDGSAMSGIIICGLRCNGYAVYVTFLMD